jgi:hypothetical protein
MMQKLAALLFLGLFIQCNGQYTFKDFSEFNISEDILENGEMVRVIYYSGAPDNNEDFTYYMHAVVVGNISKDTVYVLLTTDSGIKETPIGRYYVANSNDFSLILKNLDRLKNGGNINDLTLKDIQKVVVNNTTMRDAENDYRTIIGELVNDYRIDKRP